EPDAAACQADEKRGRENPNGFGASQVHEASTLRRMPSRAKPAIRVTPAAATGTLPPVVASRAAGAAAAGAGAARDARAPSTAVGCALPAAAVWNGHTPLVTWML